MGRSGAALLGAFVAVVLSFSAATLYTEWKLAEIDTAAAGIAALSMPAIQHLDEARHALRRLGGALDEYVDQAAVGQGPDRRPIDALRGQIGGVLRAYGMAKGAGPPARIEVALDELDRSLDRLITRVDARDFPGARSRQLYDVGPREDALDDVLLAEAEVQVQRVYEEAGRIARVRRSSSRIAVALDALCVLVTIVAAWLALLAVRDHARLLENNARLLERRSEELELFAKRVAHDVLGPLQPVALALDLARREDGCERHREAIARGARSVKRVKEIVDDLLQFARAGAAVERGARADVGQAIQGVLDEFHERVHAAHIDVEVVPFAPRAVAAGSGMLASAISNLVANAVKYMGEALERRITIRVLDRESRVRLEVEDTGPGLPAELQEAVFRPYFRAPSSLSQPGLGLGLATVERIAKAHGGDVGVRSAPGHGTCFWVELPRA